MATRAAGNPEILAYLKTKQPIAGGPGLPEDVAEGALYLCEPASRFVTGTVLPVDGGWCVSEGQYLCRRTVIDLVEFLFSPDAHQKFN